MKHKVMKINRQMEIQLHTFLTSALNGGVQSVSFPRERAHVNKWLAGCVGPRHGMDEKVKMKLCLFWESNPVYPACSLVIVLTELSLF
jgi:hypothetical protein